MSIEFMLDGRSVTAEPGQTILEVATANGIKIPTLCRENRISKTTSCFVCVVKDKKTGRFLPSCSACPVPGQDIDASGPEVIDMRRTAPSEHSLLRLLYTVARTTDEYVRRSSSYICSAVI